jgi:hypothetical protein
MAKTAATKTAASKTVENVAPENVEVMQESKSTAIVAAPANAVVSVATDFMDASDFGAGFEGVDQDSFAIPFLIVLQKMSPIVDEDSPKHVKGAKQGMVYNTVTGELYDVREKPLDIIQAAYKRTFILWGGDRGGFKGEFTPEQMDAIEASGKVKEDAGKIYVLDDKGQFDPKKSDYYADTRAHYVVVINENGESSPAILSLASTQIKSSKMLMTALQNKKVEVQGRKLTPATYANRVKFTTSGQQNEKGSWAVASFALDGLVTDRDLFQQAKDLNKAIASGAIKADYEKAAAATGEQGVSDQPQEAAGF